ncbi:MAG: c-type cytochrome [Rhodospirillales bacterium]|nr:MAG: c-type cytochrome [Rhodospirillales bacterium]
MSWWPHCLIPTAVTAALLAASPAAAQDTPDFAAIAGTFEENCVACHGGEDAVLGLRLDSLDGVKRGSENGPVAVPGRPGESELVRRIKGISEPRMPLTGPPFLDDAQIADIESWVAAGMPGTAAPGPEAVAPPRHRPAPGESVAWSDVAPILMKRCVKCHTDGGLRGRPPEGLRLKTREMVLAGGERVAVIPGNAGASELVRRIRGQSRPRMPLDGPPFLDGDEIRLITDWIAQGAPDDSGRRAPVPVGARVRFEGVLTGRWQVDGTPVTVTGGTRIDKPPRVGDGVEVRGTVGADGSVLVQRLRRR